MKADVPKVNQNSTCKRAFAEWPILTATIPDNSVVLNSTLTYDLSSRSGIRNCNYTEILTRPSTTSNGTLIWNSISTGLVLLGNDASCTPVTITNPIQVDLGIATDQRVQAQLLNDWFALGITKVSEVRDITNTTQFTSTFKTQDDVGAGTTDPTLKVWYTYTT